MTALDLKPRHIAPGLTVNPLGVGCWAIGGPTVNAGYPVGWGSVDDARSLDGLRTALEHGANFFDTADVFGHGHSERLLGQLLKEVDRESVHIASKIGWVRGTAQVTTAWERVEKWLHAHAPASAARISLAPLPAPAPPCGPPGVVYQAACRSRVYQFDL
jgi:aryl-alcohol dehydrogenase-like predicted oxidoreductase